MEASEVINEILKFHDEIGEKFLLAPGPEEVRDGLTASGVIRTLLDRIGHNLIHNDDQRKRFFDALQQHIKAAGAQLLYNRNLDFND